MSRGELDSCARRVLELLGPAAALVSITFVDDDAISALHEKYRKRQGPTDVLAFELSDRGENSLLGDVYISMDRIIHQAKSFRVSRKEETIRLLVHGLLHLCGYRDDTAEMKEQMFMAQERVVQDYLNGRL